MAVLGCGSFGHPGYRYCEMSSAFFVCVAFSASEGNFPSLRTPFSLFCTVAGGFSLTFTRLILWHVCNLNFLSLLPKQAATRVASISHLGVIIGFYYPVNRAQPKQHSYELCICCI